MCEFCGCGMQRPEDEQRGNGEVVTDAERFRSAVGAARAEPDRPRAGREQPAPRTRPSAETVATLASQR